MGNKSKAVCAAILAALGLNGAAAARAADKIIYIRPVPNNEDQLLKQGTTGVQQAAQMYGLQALTLESQASRAGRQTQLEAAIRQQPRFIVLMGYEFGELLADAARQAPQTQFLWMEHCLENAPANLHCVQFRESDAAYLVGMEAALSSSNGKIGVLGPVDSVERRRLAEAYAAGAKAAKPAVQLYPVQWVGGALPFDDAARAEQSTRAMLAAGVDVVYAIAGNSNQGALHALENQGKGRAKLIGHPVNQCHMAPGRMLDSVEVHYDTAIALSVNRIMSGTASPRMEFGLKENALALTSISPDGAWSECEASKDKPLLQRLRLERSSLTQKK